MKITLAILLSGILLALALALTTCRAPSAAQPSATPPLPTLTLSPTLPPAPSATALPRAEYDERAQSVTLESAALGVPKTFYVYTPPGYEDDPAARFPVLYLFRGHEREWLNRSEDPSRQGRNVLDVYEELLAAGEVGPMILVFPGIASDDNQVMGMLVNFRQPERAKDKPGVGTGRWEDFFVREVIPYVDTTFRTVADRAGRAADGFSMGGFMSTKIAAQHPDLFGSVGAFDGLYFYTTPDCAIDAERDRVFRYPIFAPAWGTPPDLAFAAQNNAATLLCASDAATVQSIRWFIQYGPESAEPNDSNFYRGEHLVELLKAKGATNSIEPVLTGGHRWATADEHLRQTLPLHWQAMMEAVGTR